MSNFPETDITNRVLSLGIPAESAVVVGDTALESALGADVYRADTLEVALSEDAYRYIRVQPGVEETVLSNGDYCLAGDDFTASLQWAGRTPRELRQGGYVQEGVAFAGLPDVYGHKQQRGTEQDQRDLAQLRGHLYGNRLLPAVMLAGERSFITDCVPEHLHERPELEVAANGLYIVRTVFGHEDGEIHTYSGSAEEGPVPASFHAWRHTALGTRDGQRNIDVLNQECVNAGRPPLFSDDDRMATLVGYSCHDAILGHGRRRVNPEGHDERQSADLAVRHLEAAGVTKGNVLEGAHAGGMATTYNEITRRQDIDPSRGYVHIQENTAGSDFSGLRRKDGALNALRLAPEDLGRTGAGYDQPLARLVEALNAEQPAGTPPIRITSASDAFRLIDAHPDFPATVNGEHMTLREATARHIAGNKAFFLKHQPFESWRIGEPGITIEHAECLAAIAQGVAAGELKLEEAHNELVALQ